MKVLWFIQGEDEQYESRVECATDFLQTLELVDNIALDSQEFKVISTEIVVADEPYIAVLLDDIV